MTTSSASSYSPPPSFDYPLFRPVLLPSGFTSSYFEEFVSDPEDPFAWPQDTMPVPDPAPQSISSIPITLPYKRTPDGEPIYLDLYAPDVGTFTASPDSPVPVCVYFHGGGICVGDRTSWFPNWLRGAFSIFSSL